MWPEKRFVTPEAVALEAEVAGLGSRFIGALVDSLIQGAVILVAAIAGFGLGLDGLIILLAVSGFVMLLVYPAVLEGATRGKTVGKMAARTRVVRTDGTPVTVPAVLVRNAVRLVDLLPSGYAVGAIAILVTRQGQRLGDLAAGTMVVYDAPKEAPVPLNLAPSARRDEVARGIDPAGLSSAEYGLVRSFLLRRHQLHPDARARLARDLAERLRPRVGTIGTDSSAELFLEAVAAAFRDRWREPS